MKNALEMMKEVKDYERQKEAAKTREQRLLEDARAGRMEFTWWEENITLPLLKLHLKREIRPSKLNDGRYYISVNLYTYSHRWVNYAMFLVEQSGYLKAHTISGMDKTIFADCPRTAAEQILFSKKGS